MNIRYIEINGRPAAIPCNFEGLDDVYAVNQLIHDFLRYRGDIASNLVPVETDSSTYPSDEYSEIVIRIKNANYQREESESE
jgi:hypothetical protein